MGDRIPHIEVRDLKLAYGDFLIQQDLNFTVYHGDIFVIMGGSGCGKSTLMKSMIGLKRPDQGDVYFSGQPFWASPEAEQIRLKRRFGREGVSDRVER